jgi:hypothetical protein
MMSKFDEFCEAFSAGKIKTEEERLAREDELRRLPLAIGKIVERMCSCFRCPPQHAHYVDLETKVVTASVQGSVPRIYSDPGRGRSSVGVEIRVGGTNHRDEYPVWIRLEFNPMMHGGFEFHWGTAHLQLPDEETELFDRVAETIKQELRKGIEQTPGKIGF